MRKLLAALGIAVFIGILVGLRMQARDASRNERSRPSAAPVPTVEVAFETDEFTAEESGADIALESPERLMPEIAVPVAPMESQFVADAPDEVPTAPPVDNVIATIEKLLEAAFTGDAEAAIALTKPGSSVAEDADGFREVKSQYPEFPLDVYGAHKNALAVSWLVEVPQPSGAEEGYILFFLEQDESGTWLIYDIDFENEESGALEIGRFVETYEAKQWTSGR